MGADHPAGRTYRAAGVAESIAGALPSGTALRWLRRRLRPVFHRWLASRRSPLVSVLPAGERFVVSPAHRHVSWNPDEYAAFRASVRPGATVLDVGANVGAYSVLFARWTGTAGRVVALEPDPVAFAGLEAHLRLNGMEDRVTAICAAATDGSRSRARLATSSSSGLARLVDEHAGRDSAIEVRATSIDELCRSHGLAPSVIKIDVEGAELQVLRGARHTIAAAGPELALFVEMHPAIWRDAGVAPEEVARECEAQGLWPERLDGTSGGLGTTEGVCVRLRPMGSPGNPGR
jgi:FkbM family methyltransferase